MSAFGDKADIDQPLLIGDPERQSFPINRSITDEEAFLREQQRRVFEWAKPMGGSAGRNTRLP
jgi:hypothetical protein